MKKGFIISSIAVIAILTSSILLSVLLVGKFISNYEKDVTERAMQYGQLGSKLHNDEEILSKFSELTAKSEANDLISYGKVELPTTTEANPFFEKENATIKAYFPIKEAEAEKQWFTVSINYSPYSTAIQKLATKYNVGLGIFAVILLVLYIVYSLIRPFLHKKRKLIRAFVFVFLALSLLCFGSLVLSQINLFSKGLPFNEISVATKDVKDNVYIIDTFNTRLMKVNENGNLVYSLRGNSRSRDGFFFAMDLEPDLDGNVYLIAREIAEEGDYACSERIQKFNKKGEYVKTIFEIVNEESSNVNRAGNMLAITGSNDQIFFLVSAEDRLDLYSYDPKTDICSEPIPIPTKDAVISADYDALSDTLTYATQDGEIFLIRGVGTSQSKTEKLALSETAIPAYVQLTEKGEVYYLDYASRSIQSLSHEGSTELLSVKKLLKKGYDINRFTQVENGLYRFKLQRGAIVTSEYDNVILWKGDQQGSAFRQAGLSFFLSTVYYLGFLFMALSVLAVWSFISLSTKKKALKKTNGSYIAFLVGAILLVCCCGGFLLFEKNDKLSMTALSEQFRMNSSFYALLMDGDKVEKLQKPSDYQNETYMELLSELNYGYDGMEDWWNANSYAAVYAIRGGRAITIAYNDDSARFLMPVALFPSDSLSVFLKAYETDTTLILTIADVEGSWYSGLSPIKNKEGTITGILELGTDLNLYKQKNNAIMLDMLASTVSVLMTIMLLFTELIFFVSVLLEKQKYQIETTKKTFDIRFSRSVSFLFYTVKDISLFFMPILALKLYLDMPTRPYDPMLVAAVPLTVLMVSSMITTFISEGVVSRLGWRWSFLAGCLCIGFGILVASAFLSLYTIILSAVFFGIADGLQEVSLATFIMISKKVDSSEDTVSENLANFNSGGFAGSNCGILIGSLAYEFFGPRVAFLSGLPILFACFLITYRYLPNAKVASEKQEGGNVLFFLFKKEILLSGILLLLPVMITEMFIYQYFPLYMDNMGVSTTVSSLGVMINNGMIIYLGPLLTSYLVSAFGLKRSTVLGSAVSFGAILFFALNPSVVSLYFCSMLLGIGAGFAMPLRSEFFSQMDASKEAGELKAMSAYKLYQYAGYALAPAMYCYTLNSEPGQSLLFSILISFALMALYLFISRKRYKYAKKWELTI